MFAWPWTLCNHCIVKILWITVKTENPYFSFSCVRFAIDELMPKFYTVNSRVLTRQNWSKKNLLKKFVVQFVHWKNHFHFVKGQLISKASSTVFTWTKKRTQYFSISALKIYCSKIVLSWKSPFKIRFHKKKFLERVRAEIEKYFVRFLVQMKTAKSPFEIIWTLH